jgi:hypothetical protein
LELQVAGEQLTKLLTEYKQQYVVPLYQRPYSWTTEEVDQLWEDITGDLDAEHFMGSIVLNNEDKKRPEVIDGQQRLTTLLLLLALIRDRYHELGSDLSSRPQDFLVADKYTSNAADRYKLRLGEANWEVFRDFVLRRPGEDGRRTWAEKSLLPRRVQADNANLFENARRLNERLEIALDVDDREEALSRLEDLERKVTERLTFVIIRVGSVDDAFLLFETLNDRGLQLSASDLVKSHLLSRYEAKFGKDAVADAHQEWQELLESLAGADIGRFLRYYLLQYNDKVQTDKVFGLFKKQLAATNPDKMLTEMRTMARYYGEFVRPSVVEFEPVRRVLEDLAELRAVTCYVVLMPARAALGDDLHAFGQFARLAEALAYRWTTIVGNNAQQLESIFQRAARQFVRNGADGLQTAVDILTQSLPSRGEFTAAFRHKRMGTQYVARYTLRRIEHAVSAGSEVKTPDKVEIEHILPQHLSTPWAEALGDQAADLHAELAGRWGNLTLLSRKLNKEARDYPFDVKKRLYVDEDGPGSDIRMTQLLALEPSWGPVEIDNRQQWMAMIADQLWGIPGASGKPVRVPPYPHVDEEEAARSLRQLIAGHESMEVELKSTARTNLHTGGKDEAMEWAVGKTIAAFANGLGGTLVIGVADDGGVVGAEVDYQWVKGKNADGFLLWLTDYVKSRLNPVLASQLRARRIELNDHDVWRIEVPPAGQPVFMKAKSGPERFFVRMSNATNELSGSHLFGYKESRWPRQPAEGSA